MSHNYWAQLPMLVSLLMHGQVPTVNPNNNGASKVCFFFKIFVQS